MMTNKELLKIKLAEYRAENSAPDTGRIRQELSAVLSHGSENDVEALRSAMEKVASKETVKIVGVKKIKSSLRNYFKRRNTYKTNIDKKTGQRVGETKLNDSDFMNDMKQGKALLENLQTVGKIVGGGAAGVKLVKELRKAHKLKSMPKHKQLLHKHFGEGTLGRKTLGFGAGAAGISLGIKGVEGLSDSISNPIKKRKAFNNMMDDNPGLKKESPKDVKRVFNTLFRFNPKMAGDPLVAGSFMKRTLQFKDEGIQPVDVKTLTDIGKNMSGGKGNSSILGAAFLSGAKDLAGFAG